jgi:hypothetical protein
MYCHIGLLALFAAAFGQFAGAPYSAEEVTENVQTLADGAHITHKSTVKMYRDSAGRTRTEHTIITPGHDDADVPLSIEIVDPVANVRYNWNSREKVAHKRTMGVPANRPTLRRATDARAVQAAKPAQVQGPLGPEIKTESLGSQTMEGLMVEGERRTATWPAGSQLGNDRPITSVNETWTSPDLKITVLSKHSDPRNGEHTQKLVNLSRAEPDPSLFQPPADYTLAEDERPAPR